MAPRVDRHGRSSFPARWELAEPTRKVGAETERRPGKTPKSFGHPDRWFLSLFKGQGACRRATETSSGRIATASAGV
jgi:hypothetical protein